jgi:CheY-like chemotaxis protein
MNRARPIYLVDDDEDDLLLLREAFESITKLIPIVELSDGQQLVDLMGSQPTGPEPALILLDMNMPRMSGLEVLSRIKEDPASRHIPIIMVSTCSDQELIQAAYRMGINSYITKPVKYTEYLLIAQGIIANF